MDGIAVNSIAEVLDDFRLGKMVIMVDDQDRENEGDLLVAAECVNAGHINFMATHGKGFTRNNRGGKDRG